MKTTLIKVPQNDLHITLPELISKMEELNISDESVYEYYKSKRSPEEELRWRQGREHWEAHHEYTTNFAIKAAEFPPFRPNNMHKRKVPFALHSALILWAFKQVKFRCHHLSWPLEPDVKGIPFILNTTTQTVVCTTTNCINRTAKFWEDNGLCEGCEKKVEEFIPTMMTQGPMILTSELCQDCHNLLRGE